MNKSSTIINFIHESSIIFYNVSYICTRGLENYSSSISKTGDLLVSNLELRQSHHYLSHHMNMAQIPSSPNTVTLCTRGGLFWRKSPDGRRVLGTNVKVSDCFGNIALKLRASLPPHLTR